MTEQMRRELTLALSVAKVRGIDYGEATDEQRQSCHRIARACLPGTNQLLADERINAQREFFDQLKESNRKSARKAYDDGFEDGQVNNYRNRWLDKEQTWSMEDLTRQE